MIGMIFSPLFSSFLQLHNTDKLSGVYDIFMKQKTYLYYFSLVNRQTKSSKAAKQRKASILFLYQ